VSEFGGGGGGEEQRVEDAAHNQGGGLRVCGEERLRYRHGTQVVAGGSNQARKKEAFPRTILKYLKKKIKSIVKQQKGVRPWPGSPESHVLLLPCQVISDRVPVN